jgi:hypothetical protein
VLEQVLLEQVLLERVLGPVLGRSYFRLIIHP